MNLLWEDLKMLFEVILTVIVVLVIFGVIFGEIFLGIFGQMLYSIYTNDTNNTNEQTIDYETYVREHFNPNFNKNTQTVEENKDDTDYITNEDLQKYKENNSYIPGKTNPFSSYE